jgi:hypothetical protein
MRPRAWALFVLGLSLLVGLAFFASDKPRSPIGASAPSAAGLDAADPEQHAERTLLGAATSTSATTLERAAISLDEARLEAAAAILVPEREPPARLRGRVFDERWFPLHGARVSVCSIDLPWRAGTKVSTIEHEGALREGFRVRTDQHGAFEILAPAPTSHRLQLRIECGDERTISRRDYDEDFVFVAGDNHLGQFALQDAGVLRGRVRSTSGEPIAGAVIASLSWHGSPKPSSGADGRFHFPSMPIGEHSICISANGFDAAQRLVDLRARTPSVPLEIALAPTPPRLDAPLSVRVEGIVVDAQGVPVPRVILYVNHGRGTWTTSTDGDGRFNLDFPGARHARIGFAEHAWQWTGETDLLATAPGQLVRLVLQPNSRARFIELRETLELLVIDARTGAPIPRYSAVLRAAKQRGASDEVDGVAEALAQLLDAPGGLREFVLRPEHESIRCAAPGYAPHDVLIRYDEPGSWRQTLRLSGESRVRGRVAFAAYPTVRLVRARDSSRVHTALGEADGSFEIDGLAAGTYTLLVAAPQREPQRIDDIELAVEQTLELGEIRPEVPEHERELEAAPRWPKSGW